MLFCFRVFFLLSAYSEKTAKEFHRCRRKREKNFSVVGENGERISAYSAITAKEFLRCRRLRRKNFSVFGDNGEEFQRCRQIRRKIFTVVGEYGKRISPLLAKTAKECHRCRRKRQKKLCIRQNRRKYFFVLAEHAEILGE